MKRLKKYIWKIVLLFILFGLALYANYTYVTLSARALIFDNITDIPNTEYALFLGTPKYLSNGEVNNYYKYRIKTTTQLYTNKKVQKIIISADVSNKYGENEVQLIKSDFIQEGIKEQDIVLDIYGNSTWKSVSFLEKKSDINNVIIVSQEFHLERALYIAREKKINAIGFTAKGKMSDRLWIREILARVKMQLDIIKN